VSSSHRSERGTDKHVLGEEFSSALEVDHALTEVEREIDLLLNITPVNAAEAWADFEQSGFTVAPTLQSRPLEFDPDILRRRLYDLEIENVEDPVLANLFTEKRDETARQITLLGDRDTSKFVHESLQIFGEVADALVQDAHKILEAIDPEPSGDSRVSASGFAEAAERELEHYRKRYPGFAAELEVRSDVADLMVSYGRLLIPATAYFRSGRVEPLIQHEIGTHVVTYENGNVQPLKLLTVGLPRYDETQEGLAVLAEFVTGGLDPLRIRLLAGRVVAVDLLLSGADFMQIFEELHATYGFGPRSAWGIAIRVARSGGMTKDVIYLRGISRVLEFVGARKTIEPLLVGKLSVDHVPLIEDLTEREILRPPWIRPHWTEGDRAEEMLGRAFEGLTVHDLVAEAVV
jgi:uncharacterized protein (TIGR02421 family)